MRLRLDRLIAKIQVLDDQRVETEFERQLRLMHAAGRFDLSTLKSVLAAFKKETEVVDAGHGTDLG